MPHPHAAPGRTTATSCTRHRGPAHRWLVWLVAIAGVSLGSLAASSGPASARPDSPQPSAPPDAPDAGTEADASSPAPEPTAPQPAAPSPADPSELERQQCVQSFESSQHRRREGKLLSARAELRSCAQERCPEILRNRCMQWLREVEGELPSIVLVARDASDRDLVAVRVELDGDIVARRLDGRPLSLDPGQHSLRAEHNELPPVSMQILVRQGKQNRPVLIRFDPPAGTKRPGGGAAGDPGASGDPSPVEIEPVDSSPPLSPLVWVGFGTGAAALVVGVVTGIVSLIDGEELQEQCPDNVCTRDKEDDLDEGLAVAHVSTVSFVVMGVGAVVGVVGLALTDWSEPEPDDNGVALRPIIGVGSLGLEGRF